MGIKRYSRKEPLIFMWVMIPYSIAMNLLIFGTCIFQSSEAFWKTLGLSILYFAVIYALFGIVAVLIKKRFPDDADLFKRIGILLTLFYIMNFLMIQGVYAVYEITNWSDCIPQRKMEWWMTAFGCIASTILTFVNEAAVGWEKWKSSVTETSRLQNAYQRSRLLSLKRQINPHFLFNCFNALSSLIQEDEKHAEQFLDEMTKVYRYLLKGDEEHLVTLEEELKFIGSYLYLSKTRFGSALELSMEVARADHAKSIAPLSLQVVLENIIYRNAFSKANPMRIRIYSNKSNELMISNTVQAKSSNETVDLDEGLDELVSKYKLLCKSDVQIRETASERTIIIPLIEKEELPV